MKKKKLLYAVLLLLIVVIPFTITFGRYEYSSPINFRSLEGAAAQTITGTYRFSNGSAAASYVYGADKIPAYCIKSGVCKSAESKYWMGEAVTGTGTSNQKFYHTYCLQFGKRADGKPGGVSRPYLTAKVYKEQFDSGVILNKAGNAISDTQRDLLQDLLASGYHYSEDHSKSVYKLTNGDHIKRMFTKQILVWEIVEGARTNFTDVVPDGYHASNSAYYAVISKKNNLLTPYKAHLAAAQEYREKRLNGAPIFGKEYSMRWNNSTNKYEAVITESLNGFSNCKANDSSITVTTRTTTSGTETIVSSPKKITNATITCSYSTNGGSSTYTYFTFTDYSSFQNLVYAEGGSTIEKSFTVRSEASNVYINKYNTNGQKVDGAVFTLTLKNDSKIKFTLTGNKTKEVIEKSGIYILRETTAPHGYTKISEAELNIDIRNGTITSSNSSVQVSYDSTSNTFNINVVDGEKSFDIKKVNDSNKEVKGATFKIYSGNNEVKFNKSNNVFSYAENGSETNIVDSNYSVYLIKFLPKGIYKVVETSVPSPYILSEDTKERTFYIKVEDDYKVFNCDKDSSCKNPKLTVNNSVIIKNYESIVEIIKTGNGGLPLGGVKFLLLNEDKNQYIKCNFSSNEYSYNLSSSNMSDGTVLVTNNDGKIIVRNLPMGTYYLKEIETIDPYVLPDGDAVYTKLVLEMKSDGLKLNGKSSHTESISNASKQFNFYKIDENGNYLSGGKFKIQRFNEDTGKYEDIKLVSVENDGNYQSNANIFKEDSEGKVQFSLAHGIATFIEMTPGTTYRILELEAPKGYELTNVDNSAIVKLDKKGYAKGSAIIINQTKKLEGSTAQAELIIEIQTGKKLVRYGLIIGGTLILIIALMTLLIYITKKRK